MKRILLIAISAASLGGCTEQRDLYDVSSPQLSIRGDWEPSLGIADMTGNATAVLYKGGAVAAKSYFRAPGSATANVSRGDYGVLIFNGQMFSEKQTNLDFIEFRNTGSAETFEAFSVRAVANGRLTLRSGDENLVNNEMALLASAYAGKSIEDNPVYFLKYEDGERVSANGVTHVEEEIELTTVALSHYGKVVVDLVNPASAAVANGALRGFAHSVYMATGLPSHVPGTHQMRLNNLALTSPTRGWIESADFVTFGPPLDLTVGRVYSFELSVVLINGETFEATVDVTDQVLPAIARIREARANGILSPLRIDIRVEVELPEVDPSEVVVVIPWSDDEVIRIKV